ncbi:MAG: phosphotransferase [Bacteroidales bacterium]|nr:phosphotransferase [Bacteroidales bacterium]
MIHDLIIWPNAGRFRDEIIQDMRSAFRIVSVLQLCWDNDRQYDNFKVFYSRSWRGYPSSRLKSAIDYKSNYCGNGPFTLVVFDDPFPAFSVEPTTDGESLVNINVFNKKKVYRKLTGGGHLIHASNDAKETDRDLCLLTGLGTEAFLKAFAGSADKMLQINRNCSGVDGYASLEELFYTLNHTIDYCVLRNFESIPDGFFEQGHEDIDLLVEDLYETVNLTLAKPISGSKDRVDYMISIAGKEIPFDFRHLGDNYYDLAWEIHILEGRVFQRDLFYVPGPEDLYYALLYHAYIQKYEVKIDYIAKLGSYGQEAGVEFNPEPKSAIQQLDAFMGKNGYEYIKPKDGSVVYNMQNLTVSEYAFRNGTCISHTIENGQNGFIYTSKVFEGAGIMVKWGTPWLIENETRFLKKLSSYDCFPRAISKSADNQQVFLKLSRLEGVEIDRFFRDVKNQTTNTLRSVLRQLAEILLILCNNGIMHRDFIPSNVIVDKSNNKVKVGLIDFGWAVDASDTEVRNPSHLGGRYAQVGNHSDSYAVAVFLMENWPDLPYVKGFASLLFQSAKGNTEALLRRAVRLTKIPMGPYEWFRLLLRRHQRISVIKHRLFK